MEDESKVSAHDEEKYPDICFRNSRITEILELVFNQPMTENERKNILLNYWDKYDNLNQIVRRNIIKEDYRLEEDIQEEYDLGEDIQGEYDLEEDIQGEYDLEEHNREKDFCEFDVLCMYMLDCVFRRDGPTMSAVSRSLYCYMKCLNLSKANRIDITNCTENDFVDRLRDFTNFNSAEGEDILVDAVMKSLLEGNYGLLTFLLKFGLVDNLMKVKEKTRKVLKKLVNRFNDIYRYNIRNGQAEDMQPFIKFDDLVDVMRRSDNNLMRSMLTFFFIVIISEFRLSKNLDNNAAKTWMSCMFLSKLVCMYEMLDATTETELQFKDIEIFIVKFLNPLINADFGKSLAEFSRNTYCLVDTLTPRSLKDLTRSTIRDNLQNSMIFPEQVSGFDIPVDLKEFLLYHSEGGIFKQLKESHHASDFEEILQLLNGIISIDLVN